MNLKNSAALKIVCYIALPIFALIFVLSLVYTIYAYDNLDKFEGKEYYETEDFSNRFMGYMVNDIKDSYNNKNISSEIIQTKDNKIYNINKANRKNILFVLVDKNTNNIYTNMEINGNTDSIKKLKDIILSSEKYFCYEENKVNTNIENLSEENIKYSYLEELLIKNDISVYAAIEKDIGKDNSFYGFKEINEMTNFFNLTPCYLLPVTAIILIAIISYLLIAIGHKEGCEGIDLNFIDEIPLEIVIGIFAILFIILCSISIEPFREYHIYAANNIIIVILITLYILIYTICAITGVTIIKRLKAKTLIKNTICYRVFKIVKKFIVDLYKKTTYKISVTLSVFLWIRNNFYYMYSLHRNISRGWRLCNNNYSSCSNNKNCKNN